MTISFLMVPTLDNNQLLIFQILHTSFHFTIVVFLLYIGLLIFLKDRTKIEVKKLLITGIFIEIVDLVLAFNSLFIPIGGGIALLFGYLMLIVAENVILYLQYYEKGKISEIKVILLYFIACIPAFILSIWLTKVIFDLVGIESFIFNFNILG